MTIGRKKLTEEIDGLQGFINNCKYALGSGLGLDEATCERYNIALERHRELEEMLRETNNNGIGIYTSARLMRKEAELRVDRCKVEAVTELDRETFSTFENHMVCDYDFIHDHLDYMYQDSDGINHCLLVLCEGQEDGVLVESEGADYARYSALLPNARSFMQKQIQTMADDLIKQGTAQTANGSWVIGFDEISQHFDITVTQQNGIGQLLIAELKARDDVAEVIATEDCIEMNCYLNNAPITDDADKRFMTLFSLMGCNLEDIHIVDADEEHDLATIVELNQNTLTEEGKREWADVLGAKVNRIFEGYYGTQIEVTGCPSERLEAFSKMLAGECTISESERWLNPSVEENTMELKYDNGGGL